VSLPRMQIIEQSSYQSRSFRTLYQVSIDAQNTLFIAQTITEQEPISSQKRLYVYDSVKIVTPDAEDLLTISARQDVLEQRSTTLEDVSPTRGLCSPRQPGALLTQPLPLPARGRMQPVLLHQCLPIQGTRQRIPDFARRNRGIDRVQKRLIYFYFCKCARKY
jgi:hypothetical protein